MKKKKQVSVMAAVALALGATTTSNFPSFSEATAMGAIPFEHSNDSYQPTSSAAVGKAYAKTKQSSGGGTPPDDASYIPERVAKCGQTQASGGSKGDKRIFTLPAKKGKKIIRISYDMLSIPDKLQVIYEGKEVLNTGFVSDDGTRTIALNGKSNQLRIVLVGNSNRGTVWSYRVDCPK
jgi:hypothetical protein